MKEGRAFAWFATIKPGGEAEFKANNGFECINIPLEEPYIDTHACTSTMNAVGINSKNPERAVMLLDMVNSDKALYNLLSFGIENVNYKKVADNKIELIADSGYTGTSWATGNVFNSYLLPGQADDVWEQTIALNNSAVDAPGLGFTFNQDPIKAEMAAVVAVRGQYENLEYATDVDYWKKLEERNAKYKASGLDKIQAEMQKQLDAWKAATGK
jgi:putative aldouronate transport system substrate-binding protein